MTLWRNDGRYKRGWFCSFIFLGFLSGCESAELGSLFAISGSPTLGGIVVADDPQAAVMAQKILDGGGTAADAAVALGFGLAVTLPSRAGLGGAGACIVYDYETRLAEYLDFRPKPAVNYQEHAKWQMSIPALAAGLFALHAKYGVLSWSQVVSPAETYSLFNRKVGRALAIDIEAHSRVLSNDPSALDAFMSSTRTLAGEGASVLQVNLSSTLSRIRERAAPDFYNGDLAHDIAQASKSAGASLGISDLKGFKPNWLPLSGEAGHGVVLYNDFTFQIVEPLADKNFEKLKSDATTGFAVADAAGNAVVCQLTMTTPFGLGLMLNKVGFLAIPVDGKLVGGETILPPMAIAIDEYNNRLTFVGVSKQSEDFEVLNIALKQSLASKKSSRPISRQTAMRTLAGYPGVNMLHCKNGLVPSFANCEVYKDPLGYGYGIISYGEP
ncbi:MAG: gamma-glutamyltransferase [Rhodospirillaceae bacterium]